MTSVVLSWCPEVQSMSSGGLSLTAEVPSFCFEGERVFVLLNPRVVQTSHVAFV